MTVAVEGAVGEAVGKAVGEAVGAAFGGEAVKSGLTLLDTPWPRSQPRAALESNNGSFLDRCLR
jgi:hypothetical protein